MMRNDGAFLTECNEVELRSYNNLDIEKEDFT